MRAFLKRGGGTFSQRATGAGEAVLLGWSSREDVIPAECITSVRPSLAGQGDVAHAAECSRPVLHFTIAP